jgi:hypothetical protein
VVFGFNSLSPLSSLLPGSVNTEYHGQPRAIKRACTVMATEGQK